jgi:hypothetical protein
MKKYPFDYDNPNNNDRLKETIFVVLFVIAAIVTVGIFAMGIAATVCAIQRICG